MAERRNRYKEMEKHMTVALVIDLVLFVLYMIFAGVGIVWLKIFTAILCILVSGCCLLFLFFSQELMRPRSRWMTYSASAIAVVVVLSLILNFPSPNPHSLPVPGPAENTAAAVIIVENI